MERKRGKKSNLYKSISNFRFVNSMAKSLEKKLRYASIPENPKKVATRFFLYRIISLIITVILIGVGFLFFEKYEITKLPIFIVVGIMLFMFGAITPVMIYLVLNIDISQRIDKRRIGIEAETPAFAALFLVFLKSGISPRLLFKNLMKTSSFMYINTVAKYIIKRVTFLGESVEKAVEEAIKTIPSDLFNDLLMTYVTAIETGAPVFETMEAKVKDIMKQLEVKASVVVSNLSGLAEGYITWLSSGFITLLLMLILEAVFPLFQGLPITVWGAMAVILLPTVNIFFVWATDQMQLKFPERPLKADKLFLMLFPVGFGLGIVFMILIEEIIPRLTGQIPVQPKYLVLGLFTLTGNTSYIPATLIGLTMGFLITTIIPYIYAKRELMTGTGYDKYVAQFLRAVAEGVRSGLSVEKVLETLKDSKELGKFRTILERVNKLIRFGFPLKDAFRDASNIINEFSTRIAFSSLADMIEIGSLTPETIEILADQIEAQVRIRREYLAKIKSLLYILYIGSILVLVTSVILSSVIFSLLHNLNGSNAFLLTAQVLVPQVIYIISVSSIFNAITTGLLIGKLATGRVANGYIHVTLLLVFTTALILISLAIRFSIGPSISPTL